MKVKSKILEYDAISFNELVKGNLPKWIRQISVTLLRNTTHVEVETLYHKHIILHEGDWLVANNDNSVIHYTKEQFEKYFESIVATSQIEIFLRHDGKNSRSIRTGYLYEEEANTLFDKVAKEISQ